MHDLSLLEVDTKLQQNFDLSKEAINQQGFGLIQRTVDAQDLIHAVNINMHYIQHQQEKTHISFFQKVTFPTIKETQLYYTRGKILDEHQILNLSIPIQNIELFNQNMFQICENTKLMQQKAHNFNQLTPTEIQICKLLMEGNSIKKIAEISTSSIHTIKHHRTNIYKKLEVKNFFGFYHFMKFFKL